MLATCWAGFDEVPGVLLECGPPKPLAENFLGAMCSRVTGQVGSMAPLQNLRQESLRNIETLRRTGTGTRLI